MAFFFKGCASSPRRFKLQVAGLVLVEHLHHTRKFIRDLVQQDSA